MQKIPCFKHKIWAVLDFEGFLPNFSDKKDEFDMVAFI